MDDRRDNILPYGLAMLGLGLGTIAITFLSIAEADVSYARTQWTAWLAMALATPAILAYAAHKIDGPPSRAVWRAFWTAGLFAYGLHFFWAVYRTYNSKYGAVFEHQGMFIAASNFIVTGLWGLDVIAAWAPQKLNRAALAWLHWIVWLWVTLSFVVSSFRPGPIQYAGYLLAGAVVLILFLRLRAYLKRVQLRERAGGALPNAAATGAV